MSLKLSDSMRSSSACGGRDFFCGVGERDAILAVSIGGIGGIGGIFHNTMCVQRVNPVMRPTHEGGGVVAASTQRTPDLHGDFGETRDCNAQMLDKYLLQKDTQRKCDSEGHFVFRIVCASSLSSKRKFG